MIGSEQYPIFETSSPCNRNLVKRNLYDSLEESPSEGNFLNYSISNKEDLEINPLVIKLRMSSKYSTELQNDDIDEDLENVKKRSLRNRTPSFSSVRRSTRAVQRISYAEFISPIKINLYETPEKIIRTPRHRGSVLCDIKNSPVNSSARKRIHRDNNIKSQYDSSLERTPSKRDRISHKEVTNDIENKKICSPTAAQLVVNIDKSQYDCLETPSKRDQISKKEVINDIEIEKICSSTAAQLVVNIDKSQYDCLERTPSKRIRKSRKEITDDIKNEKIESPTVAQLVININNLDLSSGTPVSNKRNKSVSKYFFYESCSESGNEDDKSSKVLGKRAVRTPNRFKTEEVVSQPRSSNRKSTARVRKNLDEKFEPSIPSSIRTRSVSIEIDEDVHYESKTPKSKKMANTPSSNVKNTPKNMLKMIRDGTITPSMQSRSKAVIGNLTPLMKARTQLHVSYVPKGLPCREKEFSDVYNFIQGKLVDGSSGCMYISGVPGTGKTATVTAVINTLLSDKNNDVKFEFVNLNGMRLTEPRQAYVEIYKQLHGKTLAWEQAQTMLEDRFTKAKKKAPVLMLVDELDILCTKRQDVVYNLLDWPTKAKTLLIIITIANTMDLPERLLMSRVTSRLGLTRLTFQAYTHKQLQEIVSKRLTGTDSFNPDAVQFVARKVASVSGDARRALDICRRAAEIAEQEGKGQLVTMLHVNDALNAMITQPKVRAIQHSSRLEQLILQALVAEVDRTGVEETTFLDVYNMLVTIAALNGFHMVTITVALAAVSRLSACRLLLTDQKCNDINQRLILNVSPDDVYYALRVEQ